MFVMITATYPSHIGDKVLKVFQKAAESPSPVVKILGTFGRPDVECGIKVFTILEVEEGKEAEGLREIGQTMMQYRDIEEYKYSVDVVWSTEEAIALRTG